MSWIEALVDPAALVREVAPRGGPAGPQDALAMLVDGRFSWYLNSSRASGFPPLEPEATATDDGNVENRLLSGMIQMLFGLESAVQSLRRIALDASLSSDARATAAVLASVALGDALRPAEACGLLDQVIAEVHDEHGASALLQLHLGLRLSELGKSEEAVAATDAAAAIAASDADEYPELATAFMAVATSNRWRFQADGGLVVFDRSIPHSDIRDQVFSRAREAMTSYLNRRFDDVMKDPYSSSVLWQADDPVSSAFTAAVTRSECLADIETLNYVRKLAGRCSLLVGLGQERSDAFEGLHMLRRARDAKAAKAAIRMYWREGPLEPLRRTATSLLEPAPTPRLLSVDLDLIGSIADLLTEAEADSLVDRILGGEAFFPGPDANGVRALQGLLAVISDRSTTDVVHRVVELVRTSSDGLVQQRLAGLLENLPFGTLSPQTKEDLQELANDFLTGRLPPTAQSAGGAFAAALARATGSHAAELRQRFTEEPTVDKAGQLIDGGAFDPDSPIAQVIEDVAMTALVDQLEKADRGHYEARVIDVGAVAASIVLAKPSSDDSWNLLERYLFNPRVAARHKVGALSLLAQAPAAIPQYLRDRFRDEFRQVTGTDIMFGGETELASVVGRLMIAADALSEAETLRILMERAGSREPLARIHAARLLLVAPPSQRTPGLLGLALLLTHDQHPDVRAEAGHTLGALVVNADSTWKALLLERLIELATEGGARVPLGAVTGLSPDGQRDWPTDLTDTLSELARTHLSSAVRRAATAALQATPST